MMLSWIQTLIDSVPADFAPELFPAEEGETVKGVLPDEIVPWFRAFAWARLEAERVRAEHAKTHDTIDFDELLSLDPDVAKKMAAGCREARMKEEQLESRSAILGNAVREALIEHFDLMTDANVEVRVEGVVVIEPVTTNDVSGLGLLMAALAGADSSSGPRPR